MTKKVDINKIKKGDTVLITAEVVDVNPRMLKVLPLSFLAEPQWISPEGVHSHIPAPVNWKAGDKYKIGERGPWTILFIDEHSVYQQYREGSANRYTHNRAMFDSWDKEKVS